jgi:hypothetical protein
VVEGYKAGGIEAAVLELELFGDVGAGKGGADVVEAGEGAGCGRAVGGGGVLGVEGDFVKIGLGDGWERVGISLDALKGFLKGVYS